MIHVTYLLPFSQSFFAYLSTQHVCLQREEGEISWSCQECSDRRSWHSLNPRNQFPLFQQHPLLGLLQTSQAQKNFITGTSTDKIVHKSKQKCFYLELHSIKVFLQKCLFSENVFFLWKSVFSESILPKVYFQNFLPEYFQKNVLNK